MRFVVVPELRGRWSWELRDAASQLVAASALSFVSRQRALAGIREFRASVARMSMDEVGSGELQNFAGTGRTA